MEPFYCDRHARIAILQLLHWDCHIETVIKMFNSKPWLFKNGRNQQHLDTLLAFPLIEEL